MAIELHFKHGNLAFYLWPNTSHILQMCKKYCNPSTAHISFHAKIVVRTRYPLNGQCIAILFHLGEKNQRNVVFGLNRYSKYRLVSNLTDNYDTNTI